MAVIVTVAPVGPIATRADNPHLPTQPAEIADAVVEAYEAGAVVAHLHFRDIQDRPTADPQIAQRTIDMVADRCPVLVQVSTGVGFNVPFEDRAALVELRPRMATLNPCTMTFGSSVFDNPPAGVRRLASRMRDLGIKPELEIYDSGHLDECLRLRDEGYLDPDRMQFSIVLGVRGGMAATPQNLFAMVGRLPADAVWQVVAIGRENLRLSALALALGGNARAGLEDTLHIRRGELSKGSRPLVDRVIRLAEGLDLDVASVVDAEQSLGLPDSVASTNA
jgi:3-keto-5-aminohexanoate cleavage enzyme